MEDTGVAPVVLSDEESSRILSRRILPDTFRQAAAQERPVVVFVAGQPGSGKTFLTDVILESFAARGGAVRICSDLYKTAHPAYGRLLAEDEATAGARVRPDTRRWQAAVEAHGRAGRLDMVIETALSDPSVFRQDAAWFHQAGYRIEVVVLATAEAVSQLSTLERYLRQVGERGVGRFVSEANHDACSSGLLETLSVIEAEGLADRVMVVRRGAEQLYVNELCGGTWSSAARAVTAVSTERIRLWSAPETARFCTKAAAVVEQALQPELTPGLRQAITNGLERAMARSEPVRRRAQTRTRPPGVDYHRLAEAEHAWTFDNLIVPTHLGQITAQRQPVAVYVLGQPGAGKTSVTNTVARAMKERGVTRISGGDFKVMHPDYLRLQEDNSREAGAAVRADYRAWIAQAEGYVRERRGDVLIEAAPGSVEEFWRGARPFAEAGYRIEVVMLAVREADSRQGTAHRHALQQRRGLPGRFTSKAGHDRCYRALPAVVRSVETDDAITSVTVLRRDFTVLYRQEVGTGWTGAALALAAERCRRYTEAEAACFLRAHKALLAAMPRYRRELEEIASLARELMPERLRPRPLHNDTSTFASGARLPVPRPRGDADYTSEVSSL
ncbi:zeta toxin family protein [Streptomyces sp. NPDC058892]|uniref:zeta toxin family protein n=1 Tax=unclassified Streptomyces TaxID=2593676 RepID=UPI0036BF8407